MKYYNLDPLPIVSGDPAELFFDDREDCEFARTLAARTAAIISQVRRYTVTRYTYSGRQIIVAPSTRTPGGYIVPAQVLGMYADGDGVQVWCTDLGDGCDWFFTVDAKTDLRIYDRVQLVVEDNDTPDDFTDDRVVDALFCHDCDDVDD